MPLVLGGYFGSTWPQSAFKKNVGVDPVKIEALPTPRESHGTKILGYIFFSCHPLLMFFYWFCWLIWQKVKKNLKKGSFSAHFFTFCYLLQRKLFSFLFTIFCIITPKTYQISSIGDGGRKILSPKFWSHGTPLGWAGPLFWQDPPQQFVGRLILVMWNLNDLPVLVASETHTKKLKPIPAWCDHG